MSKLLVALTLFLTFFGCSKNKPKNAQVMRISITSEPSTIDPRRGGDFNSCILSFMLFEGLTYQEKDGSIRLAAAESVQLSPERTIYRFILRDAKWSNGTKIRAKDFEYAWKSALRPNFPCPSAYLFYPIKNARRAKEGLCSVEDIGVHAITDRELVVELERPTPYFLELISFCAFFPICAHEEMQNPDWMNHPGELPPTNGPFTLANWQHRSEITVEKNPHYWDASSVQLDGIDINIVESMNTALQLFEKNKIDWVGGTFIATDYFSPYEGSEELNKDLVAGLSFISFNTREKPFNNLNIRKAFSYAIDRSSIVSNIAQNRPAGCLIPPSLCKDNLTTNYFRHSSRKQAQHYFEEGLKELGLTKEELPTLKYTYFNNDNEKRVAQALQNQWRETLGISVELVCLEMKVFLDNMYKKNYAFSQFGALAQYFDAMNILERFSYANEAKNYPAWENSAYQSILEQAAVESEDDKRLALYHEAESILMSELPICPLYFLEIASLKHKNFENVILTPIGSFNFRNVKAINNKSTESL